MSHILWLASFPKSGNTWMRAFLANYLTNSETPVGINDLNRFATGDIGGELYAEIAGKPAEQLSDAGIHALRPQVHRRLAAVRPGAVFVKTHAILTQLGGTPTITPEVTAAAIYIVRNPLDVAVSMIHHYGYGPEDAAAGVCFDEMEILPTGGRIPQRVSSWTNHVRAWRRARGLNLTLVRYEDLVREPEAEFGKVLAAIGVTPEPERVARAVRHSSFKVLAAQEQSDGFVENSRSEARFFRAGGSGGWRDALTPDQVDQIIEKNRDAMVEIGYITPQGEFLV